MTVFPRSLIRFPLRHPRATLLVWALALLAALGGRAALGGEFADSPGAGAGEAEAGMAMLRAHGEAGGAGRPAEVVFVAGEGLGEEQRRAIERSRARLAALPHVGAVSDPLAPARVSRSGEVAYATLELDAAPGSLGAGYLDSVEAATAPARAAGVAVEYGGALGQAMRPKVAAKSSELVGMVVALAVLLAGFGSVLAALLPLLAAGVAVLLALGLLGLLAGALAFVSVAPTLATMIGLGVGIDYALFLVTRFRQRLRDGLGPEAAVAETLVSSGRAVAVAAVTVVIAMCGLYVSGIDFVGRLGLAAGLAVAVAALAALTLVPALLTLIGSRIDRWTVRAPLAEPRGEQRRFGRYVAALARRPWLYGGAGVALLGVLAIPAASLELGHADAGSQPREQTERRAYDALAAGFGPGVNGPLTVVVATPAAESGATARELRRTLAQTPGVAAVSGAAPSADRRLAVATVVPASAPGDPATAELLRRLRDATLPSRYGERAHVTGATAAQLESQEAVAERLPAIVIAVVAAALVLLLASFGSPVLALKAALLNLLSIGAAYGVLVAVFQWGWGAGLLGIAAPVPIESFVPMMMFAIVFGLSMDYEVFLLSRVREHHRAGLGNQDSVAMGLADSARVITCAAAIMASVFFAFLLSGNVVVQMLALGLGVSVIVDATVIRLLVVPALMFVFGRANWWVPRWLGFAR